MIIKKEKEKLKKREVNKRRDKCIHRRIPFCKICCLFCLSSFLGCSYWRTTSSHKPAHNENMIPPMINVEPMFYNSWDFLLICIFSFITQYRYLVLFFDIVLVSLHDITILGLGDYCSILFYFFLAFCFSLKSAVDKSWPITSNIVGKVWTKIVKRMLWPTLNVYS